MDAARWRRIGLVFDEIVDLPDAEREAALDRSCAGDAGLRAEVVALLKSDAVSHAAAWLDAPASVAADWAGRNGEEDVARGSIGYWRIDRELGRGGMGVVYLAERADGQFEQRAALKLIRTDGDSAALRRRFLRERQILADLEHPNIARLLDGGIAEDGRPYFAMEYIDGRPLLDFVNEQRCDLRARLKLFVEICGAVQFAHRRLVVHRDIKPSNVLVTPEGRVKLLDFGVATLHDPSANDTQTRVHPLTPAYAAPEQLRGAAVTTAADIYALGVLLYELLSGVRPYRLDDSASPLEWARIVDGPLCSAPSVAANEAMRDSARRPRVPPLPARALEGDLDVIALTALRREPERRYASVDALAGDVENYLDGRPITARADSARYVIGKFIGRHRVGTAAATAAALILVAALGAALLQDHRARAQARRAHAAAALAQEQARRAEAVRQFLVGVFDEAEPDAHQGKPLTAHELLDEGEQQIGKNTGDRALEADTSALLAGLYEQISDFDRAKQLAKRALAASESATLPNDIEARVLITVAGVEDDNNEYDIAIAHAKSGMQRLDGTMPTAARLAAKAHQILAHCLVGKGDGAAAEAVLRDALKTDVAALGDHDEKVGEEWIDLGSVLGNAGRYGESEAAFQRGIETWRAAYGERSFHVAHALNELSNMLSDKGDLAGAERALRESLAIRMETVGPHHRDTLIVEHNLLVTLEMEGRIAESLPQRMVLIERAATSEQMRPRDLASYYTAAARDLRELGRLDESEAMFEHALAAYAQALGPHSPQSVSALRGLAATDALKGRYGDAEKTLRDALDIVRRHDDDTSLGVANVRTDLGRVLRLEHRVPEALTDLEAACDAMDRKHAADAGRPLTTAELAQAKLDSGDAGAALAIAERAVTQARAALPERHFLLAEPLFALARAQFALGHYADADPPLREALSLRKALEPANDPRVLELEVALAATDERLGRSVDARSLRREVDAQLMSLNATYAADLRQRLATSAPAPAAARR